MISFICNDSTGSGTAESDSACLILQLGFQQDQRLGSSSLVVAPFSDGLMDAAPEGPLQDEIEAEADSRARAGHRRSVRPTANRSCVRPNSAGLPDKVPLAAAAPAARRALPAGPAPAPVHPATGPKRPASPPCPRRSTPYKRFNSQPASLHSQ